MEEMSMKIVLNYIQENFLEPKNEIESYSASAAWEVYDRLVTEYQYSPYFLTGISKRHPLEIVEEFIDDMDCFVRKSRSKEAFLMFCIAKEEGETILELLQSFCFYLE